VTSKQCQFSLGSVTLMVNETDFWVSPQWQDDDIKFHWNFTCKCTYTKNVYALQYANEGYKPPNMRLLAVF
jgi:hypothetical protein